MTTDEERRRITERARAELAAATARSDAERARRRAAGEPEPRISATKGRLDSGPDMAARPGADGGVEWYAPSREEQIATPVQPGDRDADGNTTDAARERRRAIAEAAAALRGAAPGESLPAGGARVTRADAGFVVDLPDGTRQWRDDAWDLDRADAPAVEHPGGAASWWTRGRLDRADGPAVTGPRTEWWVDGRRHRPDGPAAEGADAPTEWWIDGERHRADGPAVLWPDGRAEWWLHGRRHRTDGPALEGPGTDPAWAYWLDGEHVTQDAVERRRTWFGRRTQ